MILFSHDKQVSVNEMAPLNLAFIGDAVFELYIRTRVLEDKPVQKLHIDTIKYVKAKSQSEIIEKLKDKFSETEYHIYKRGRNSKSGSCPKNSDIIDYRRATGFETLIGYLYLSGETERLNELLDLAFTCV